MGGTADRLFEGEKAGLHVIESIVGPWSSGRRNVTVGGRATSGRLSGADPISWNPFSALGPVLAAELCGLVQIGFPCAGFRALRANLVLDAAAPLERLREAIPERPQVANPRSI